MFATLPALSENNRLRIWAFFLMYVSQGVPFGLAMIAIPAWLAANGASPSQIGFFVATAMLPWSLKLANGLVMDRFCYSPMGRRRAWVIGSQVAMIVTLIVTAALDPKAVDITLLAGLCFMLNMCGALNDVAVDGMAVDLVPEDEREKTNGFMMGGQMVGISGVAVMSGAALVSVGIALAASLAAVVVVVLTLIVTLLRERPGERILPWSSGAASAECLARRHTKMLPIVSQVFRGLARGRTALFLAGAAVITTSVGMLDVAGPSFSVSELGWSSEKFTNFSSISTLITAIAVMLFIGPMVKRFGTRSIYILFASLMVIPNIAAAFAPAEMFGTLAMQAYITLVWGGFAGVVVLIIAWSMNLTNPAVAASQFSLFMAIPNFARSLASGVHGQIIDAYGYEAAFLIAAISVAAGTILCMVAGYGRLVTIPALAGADETRKSLPPAAVPAGMAA